MVKISYRFILTAFFICIVLALLNKFAFHNGLANAAVTLIRSPASFMFERVGFVRATVLELRNIRTLSNENAKLRQENTALVGRIGIQESLERENDFLRRSLRIVQRISRPTQSAGIFMSQFNGAGYQTMVNKGSSDGVGIGDIIISPEGVLIGRIAEVFSSYSRAQVTTDSAMEVGAKVLGKETMGIAQGALEQGMLLQLVVQEEDVAEGDTIVSNGHDSFPAGLILGSIIHIESNESDVFKKIRIEPALERIPLGPVLLIKLQ